jgi:acetylornithine deacetylase/succinyl-diaminopimelate desuccinylase-like protein
MRASFCFGLLLLLLPLPCVAASDETVQPSFIEQARALFAQPKFKAAAASLDRDYPRLIEQTIALTEIPAPPFQESKRARAFLKMMREAGLADVSIDEIGNVIGVRKGRGGGKAVMVAAHLDTVFPAGTDVKVKRSATRLAAPGVTDDTANLAVLLSFIRALDRAGIQTRNDILFVGNVGEEGPGDLRGVRYIFTKGKYKDRVGAFISFEPALSNYIVNHGVGSVRYQVTFRGPGGHSWIDFGLVNPAYAMANAITTLAALDVPKEPRTSFNVGSMQGGTSVNSIPFQVSMEVDMRSDGADSLRALEARFLEMVQKAAAAENASRSTARGAITVETKRLGDRPVGDTDRASEIAQIAAASIIADGGTPIYAAQSSDSNLPMSLHIPALTLGAGMLGERHHSLDEWLPLDQPKQVRHMTVSLATVLRLAGVEP